MNEAPARVSVIIPARNSGARIGTTVRAVLDQDVPNVEVQVIVVDDGSVDDTVQVARAAGARTISLPSHHSSGNPGAARNRGAAEASGDPLIFIDDDCTPARGWLEALLAAHAAGAVCVGGSLALPGGLSYSARLDYYCGWYHVHPRRPPGIVPNHPPGNISVRRAAFLGTAGFTERQPIAYSHEELRWQAELQRDGGSIVFEPRALVYHWNRPGFGNLLRRNYRWAYSAIESKAESSTVRLAWLYRFPRTLVAAAFPLALLQTVYITGCWVRAGVLEPLLHLPGILAARLAYAAGMTVGGLRWLRRRKHGGAPAEPRWT
jgi:glycosyltransferase involved in cell wall biosynthesis